MWCRVNNNAQLQKSRLGFGIESTAHSLRRGLNIHIIEITRARAEWQEIKVELLTSLQLKLGLLDIRFHLPGPSPPPVSTPSP